MPHSTYLPEKMGSAVVEPSGSFEAGSYQEFTLTYTAGYFGIDDTGSLKVVHRFASDMRKCAGGQVLNLEFSKALMIFLTVE